MWYVCVCMCVCIEAKGRGFCFIYQPTTNSAWSFYSQRYIYINEGGEGWLPLCVTLGEGGNGWGVSGYINRGKCPSIWYSICTERERERDRSRLKRRKIVYLLLCVHLLWGGMGMGFPIIAGQHELASGSFFEAASSISNKKNKDSPQPIFFFFSNYFKLLCVYSDWPLYIYSY